jgi:acetoacetate decarboxylase
MALSGYTLPITPGGASSLVPAPPWHFSGEVLMVEYLADPSVVQSFLPKGLDAGDQPGLCAAVFGDWQSCSDDRAELLNPVRSQYREFYVAIAASYRGNPIARCPFCWVDQDFSLVRGLIQGYPKKLGSIAITRSFRLGRATPGVGAGAQFGGTLAAAHHRLAVARVALSQPASPPSLMLAPFVHSRCFPRWGSETRDLDELVTGGSTAHQIDDVWMGDAELTFLEAPGEELDSLRPLQVLRGYRFSFAETISGGEHLLSTGR